MHSAFFVLLLVFVSYAATSEKQIAYYGPNMAEPRFLITTTTTTTSVTRSTSIVACTSGAFGGLVDQAALDKLPACAAGRRRRGILELMNEDNEEQFPIAPSAVQRVEATVKAESVRDARSADDPQYFMVTPFGHSFYPQEIESGFYGSPYNYGPVPLPYYGPYAKPVVGNRIFLNPILNAFLPSFLKQTSTVTETSTVFTVSISTSVAVCKPPPAAVRCAGT